MTIPVGPEGFDIVRERLAKTLSELTDLGKLPSDPDRVVQVNLQAFPVARVVRAEEEDAEDEPSVPAMAYSR